MKKLGCFWVIESPRSSVDARPHRHIIFRVSIPPQYFAGPFISEDKAIDYLNKICRISSQ